ncbi:metallophosphoesterase family protein [Rhodococcus oryzae]|uniref:metallophosphoesterase family protein n=1 Tax=Rhodococcus oryzae TaxID=2571143 RepID=UPI003711E452
MTVPYRMDAARLTISPQRKVGWFEARQLVALGARAVAASVIGSMSGRREIMAALEAEPAFCADRSGAEEIWLDYMADTGDGWNATASVTWLLGRDGLVVAEPGAPVPQPVPADCRTEGLPTAGPGQTVLPAGEVLLLGGDQVYPAGSRQEYQHRLVDPMRSARIAQPRGRTLFAIPGNHDWYDGLTSFIRQFCQSPDGRTWFGAWEAQQRRSYYALRLPHRWWVWGVDTALEDDLDPPQYDYFRARAQQLEPGDRVILCVPNPTWIDDAAAGTPGGRVDSATATKLDVIMDLARRPDGDIEVPLVLSGDHHHYVRHHGTVGEQERHYIVCGGGGAFTQGTIGTPVDVSMSDGPSYVGSARLQAAFPTERQSVRLRRGVLGFPASNVFFTAVLTVLSGFAAMLLGAGGGNEGILGGVLGTLQGFGPAAVCLAIVAAFSAFAVSGRAPGMPPAAAGAVGGAHALLLLVGGFLLVRAVLKAGLAWWLSVPISLAALYLYCGTLFGLYLFLSHKVLGMHKLEVYSAQGIEGYKSFLRIHISAQGLRVHPIGLRTPSTGWVAAPGVESRDDPAPRGRFRRTGSVSLDLPDGCQRVIDPVEPLRPHLIEAPFLIPNGAVPDPAPSAVRAPGGSP